METCGKMQGKMYNSLDYEKTELRLGLPGAGEDAAGKINIISGKRSFTATLDLKLNLEITAANSKNKEGSDSDQHHDHQEMNSLPKEKKINLLLPPPCNNDPEKPPAPKAQVVGWPPVRSYRKNALAVQSTKSTSKEEENASYSAAFVKVSMDGAPYLRKVDLKMYKSYQDLSHALEKMFSSFTIGNCGPQGMNGRDFMNESKLMDLLNGSEYVPTYEDKDGDWMLVGDVPWEMFVGSCRRLRIMKGSEAIGLAPRAVEKCKNRR